MILHCTKKLYAKLPEKVKATEQPASAIGMQAQWLNWRANLDWHFNDVFINTLLKCDMPPELVNAAASNYQPLTFDTNCNRSVQGTMNQVSQDIDYGLYYKSKSVADISPYRYSADLSHRLCGIKGQKDYIWPDREMRNLLSRLTASSEKNYQGLMLH